MISAVLGVAGALVLVATLAICAALVRRLPEGVKRFISAFTAGVFLFTVFGLITTNTLSFYLAKGLLLGLSFRLVDFTLFAEAIWISICLTGILFLSGAVSIRRLFPFVRKKEYCHLQKKQSSPSFELKVSSVLLQ